MVRNPNVAGMFYSNNKEELETTIKQLLRQASVQSNARIVIAPHAGIMYSGLCAAHSLKSLKKSNSLVVLGTNHSGRGSAIITDSEDEWRTPLGTTKIDLNLKEKLRLETNPTPFNYEHSIEIQLLFLQILFPQAKFLPILLNPANFTMRDAEELSKKLKGEIIIASSDLTHYGIRFNHFSDDDEEVIQEILELDLKKFYEKRNERTVCGWPCILTAMKVATLENLKPELVRYYNSASITNTPSDWVGYASIVFV